jgi:UDP-glucose 4-epimerase
MKTLVTGGAGCIGSDLVKALLDRGHEVVVLDNFSSGKEEHIAAFRDHPRCSVIEGDLLNLDLVSSALDNVEMVYHLAANPHIKFAPGVATDRDLRNNVLATHQLLEAMRLKKVSRIAFTSSSAVYGIPARLPVKEDDFFPRPVSLYGATKLACEALLSAFSNLFGMQCWVFRLANIVGPKIRKIGRTVISDFVYKLRKDCTRLVILGDGCQSKSYLTTEECVQAILFVVERAQDEFTVLNVGGRGTVTVTRIAEMVAGMMGLKNVKFIYTGGERGWPGDVPRCELDVTALERLGWKARWDSEESVTRAIREMLEQTT